MALYLDSRANAMFIAKNNLRNSIYEVVTVATDDVESLHWRTGDSNLWFYPLPGCYGKWLVSGRVPWYFLNLLETFLDGESLNSIVQQEGYIRKHKRIKRGYIYNVNLYLDGYIVEMFLMNRWELCKPTYAREHPALSINESVSVLPRKYSIDNSKHRPSNLVIIRLK